MSMLSSRWRQPSGSTNTVFTKKRFANGRFRNGRFRKNGFARGFTFVEMLVVVGIIILLISILLPVIRKVFQASYAANTQAEISNLQGAIGQYYTDWNAYPGPLSNDQMDTGGPPGVSGIYPRTTGCENLVLGLLGGLNNLNKNTIPPYAMTFISAEVGLGPLVLSPAAAANPQRHPPYMTAQGTTLLSPGQLTAGDSLVPEFMDRFPDPMPILYLRARVGAPGVVALNGVPATGQPASLLCQYDLQEVTPYTLYLGNQNLHTVGPTTGTITSNGTSNGFVYFQSTSLPKTARAIDQYILIAAGKDRVYGTVDDETSFGSP